jgi:acetyl-CoA C-acetyltransferase
MAQSQVLHSVYLVDGARSPFLKYRGRPGPFSASDLAVATLRPLLLRQNFAASAINELICGSTTAGPDEMNIGRLVALRLGLPVSTPAWTVARNCATGMQAIDNAFQSIALGRSQIVLAGGTDTMSRAAVLWSLEMAGWLAQWGGAKTIMQRVKSLGRLRPKMLIPVIGLLKGLTDPTIGLNMGQTAEILAHEFNLTRQDLDEYALASHQKVKAAQDAGHFGEIVPVFDTQGNAYLQDDGVRADTSLNQLSTLRPIFDKIYGKVTAGNSSQVTDGACFVLLANAQAVERYRLPVLAEIKACSWMGLRPDHMGLGPVYSSNALLQQFRLTSQDIDYWEINEAFAAQVLACLSAWRDPGFCQRELGSKDAVQFLDPKRLNVDGGAIALGHPVGASGARIILHLAHTLKRTASKRGVASICIGGGQGGSVLLERAE